MRDFCFLPGLKSRIDIKHIAYQIFFRYFCGKIKPNRDEVGEIHFGRFSFTEPYLHQCFFARKGAIRDPDFS